LFFCFVLLLWWAAHRGDIFGRGGAGATQQESTFIIALTADATPENRRRCFDAGMDTVVTKPVTQARLRELILQVVKQEAISG
jgi:CheY-like chemotaxis protein